MFKILSISMAGAIMTGIFASVAHAFDGDRDMSSGPKSFYTVQQTSPPPVPVPIRTTYNQQRPATAGGFIEFLFGGAAAHSASGFEPVQRYELLPAAREQALGPARQGFDHKYEKQLVAYHGQEVAGTIIIDTPSKFLYLVQDNGTALRYGIGVGRPGFTWAGVKQISAKREWPDWTPPPDMLKRRPDLPRHMAGGPENPLGARAMYLGSTLYRIHGSNEPWTIGTSVSSGCIRMRNEDVIDLYDRVNVGTRVIVI